MVRKQTKNAEEARWVLHTVRQLFRGRKMETAVLVTILNLRFFYDYTYSVSLDYHRIRVQIYGFFQYNKNNCVFLFLKNLRACFFLFCR